MPLAHRSFLPFATAAVFFVHRLALLKIFLFGRGLWFDPQRCVSSLLFPPLFAFVKPFQDHGFVFDFPSTPFFFFLILSLFFPLSRTFPFLWPDCPRVAFLFTFFDVPDLVFMDGVFFFHNEGHPPPVYFFAFTVCFCHRLLAFSLEIFVFFSHTKVNVFSQTTIFICFFYSSLLASCSLPPCHRVHFEDIFFSLFSNPILSPPIVFQHTFLVPFPIVFF